MRFKEAMSVAASGNGEGGSGIAESAAGGVVCVYVCDR